MVEMVEYLGNAYEVSEVGDKWVTLLDINDGLPLKLSKAEFDGLRKLKESDTFQRETEFVAGLKEGMELSISVKSLFEANHRASYGSIVYSSDVGQEFYDLYNNDGKLACMDGEKCVVDKIEDMLITFRNCNSDCPIYFTLSKAEVGIACFKSVSDLVADATARSEKTDTGVYGKDTITKE